MGPPGGPLVLLGVAASLLGSGLGNSSHSLRYHCTSALEPGKQVPQFFSVGYVNDQQFVYYDASTRRRLPKVSWITKVDKDDAQYWEWNSQRARNMEYVFQETLMEVLRYYNQSGGFHTLQHMVGCELGKDGSKQGYWKYAFDGKDYLSFDKETLTWTAADGPAQITKRKWDANSGDNQYRKAYLEGICIEWLQKYLDYGKEVLLRTEPPKVKVTCKVNNESMETLTCRVYGFYPKEIDTVWTKDGEVWMQDTFHGRVFPNSDGTYYTWLSIKIDPKDRKRYKCHVDHDGLLKSLDLAWEEKPVSNVGPIIFGVSVVFGVVALAAQLVLIAVHMKKHQDGHKAASSLATTSQSPVMDKNWSGNNLPPWCGSEHPWYLDVM